MLTWGGLRGGISVAMALSIPPSDSRSLVLTLTYLVVVFSILVQSLTVGRVIRMNGSPPAARRQPRSLLVGGDAVVDMIRTTRTRNEADARRLPIAQISERKLHCL